MLHRRHFISNAMRTATQAMEVIVDIKPMQWIEIMLKIGSKKLLEPHQK